MNDPVLVIKMIMLPALWESLYMTIGRASCRERV